MTERVMLICTHQYSTFCLSLSLSLSLSIVLDDKDEVVVFRVLEQMRESCTLSSGILGTMVSKDLLNSKLSTILESMGVSVGGDKQGNMPPSNDSISGFYLLDGRGRIVASTNSMHVCMCLVRGIKFSIL